MPADEDDEKGRVKAVSQLDGLRKSKARKPAGDGDDAFEHLEPELDELFAMDEQRVRQCHFMRICVLISGECNTATL